MWAHIGLELPRHWGDNHPLDIDFHRTGSFFDVPNKFWELQITSFSWTTLFDIEINGRPRQDHAGIAFSVTILGVYLSIQVYDNRHWNREAGRWYLPGEEEELWGKPRNPDILASDDYKRAVAYVRSRAPEGQRRKDDPVEVIQGLLNQIERTE